MELINQLKGRLYFLILLFFMTLLERPDYEVYFSPYILNIGVQSKAVYYFFKRWYIEKPHFMGVNVGDNLNVGVEG